jgi:hypothetical protein
MDAIRIHQILDSDTLHLPQLAPLIGKPVEIVVREELPASSSANGYADRRQAWQAALANLAGLDIDWDAYQRGREEEVKRAGEHRP